MFNLGENSDRIAYEKLLERKINCEIQFLEQEKSWGKKQEDSLYVFVAYQTMGGY